MLSSLNRLPKQSIADVVRLGTPVVGEGVVLRYKKTSNPPRFAVVISTKIDKRATQRNRMRRIVSESVRHVLPRITGADGVFMVRKNIAALSQKEAEKLVVEALNKAKLL